MNRAAWTYIILAFVITWSVTVAAFLAWKSEAISLDQLNIIYNLGAFGPFLAAIIASRAYYGIPGLKKLFNAFRFEGLNRRTLLVAFSPLFFFAIALLIYPLLAGHWYTFEDTRRQAGLSTPMSYIAWILPFISYAVLEEFGWRGFLLPHLQEKYSAFAASFVLTIFWASWHLPFFLWRFSFSGFITIGFFFAIFIGSVILTSIFNQSRGNIVPVILFHFSNNLASALDKEYMVAIVSTGFVFLAMYLVRKSGKANLSDVPRIRNFYMNA